MTYSRTIFPSLQPHQQVLLVPGVFGCSDQLSHFPLAAQEQHVIDKLDGYFSWAKAEKNIAGLNGWHFNTRAGPQHSAPPLARAALTTQPEHHRPGSTFSAVQRQRMPDPTARSDAGNAGPRAKPLRPSAAPARR